MKERLVALWESEKIQDYIKENREILIKVAAAALLVVAAFLVFIFTGSEEESLVDETNIVEESESEATMIMVDIGGAVKNPMVAELEEGCRVEDAIEAAGGLTEDADLTEINRAEFLEDGEKIFIPSKIISKGKDAESYDVGVAAQYIDERININTADSDELQQLNGVGPATADKIISYREENGRFKSIDEIMNVSGIGEKTFEKFKDDIKI